ncbi:MAG: hypothetical protein K0Q79_3661 [Flavipsychrobacter sp.]|jgi:3-methyladenine DNA glycosylase AlkD|nr:hypothetical protein [Flavipsychrobacter sp.]
MSKLSQDNVQKEIIAAVNATPAVVPTHRALHKKGFSFSGEPFDVQLDVWHNTWKQHPSFWIRLHAYLFLERYIDKKELHSTIWETSMRWQEDVDDWAHCDALAKLNTKILETYPAQVYAQLKKWNKDKNLWKRRQSVVSLLYFSRTKKVYLPFEQIAALVEPLLKDQEYYVQKGVGWTLREMYTVFPKETLPFLRKHIKDISPIAFTIAIEKMGREKDVLKAARKSK